MNAVRFKTKRGANVVAMYNETDGRCYLQIYGKTTTSLRNFDTAEYIDAEQYCQINNF